MTKQELLDALNELSKSDDPEAPHAEADALLLKYIADEDVARAFNDIEKWYS